VVEEEVELPGQNLLPTIGLPLLLQTTGPLRITPEGIREKTISIIQVTETTISAQTTTTGLMLITVEQM
jgi:hypothetical protein